MQNGINDIQNLLPQNNKRRGRACSPETKGQASLPVIVAVEPVK